MCIFSRNLAGGAAWLALCQRLGQIRSELVSVRLSERWFGSVFLFCLATLRLASVVHHSGLVTLRPSERCANAQTVAGPLRGKLVFLGQMGGTGENCSATGSKAVGGGVKLRILIAHNLLSAASCSDLYFLRKIVPMSASYGHSALRFI